MPPSAARKSPGRSSVAPENAPSHSISGPKRLDRLKPVRSSSAWNVKLGLGAA